MATPGRVRGPRVEDQDPRASPPMATCVACDHAALDRPSAGRGLSGANPLRLGGAGRQPQAQTTWTPTVLPKSALDGARMRALAWWAAQGSPPCESTNQ